MATDTEDRLAIEGRLSRMEVGIAGLHDKLDALMRRDERTHDKLERRLDAFDDSITELQTRRSADDAQWTMHLNQHGASTRKERTISGIAAVVAAVVGVLVGN